MSDDGAIVFPAKIDVEQYRAEFPQQPLTDTADLSKTIMEFETALPGWWWSICVCSRTRDASCGPDLAGPDYLLLSNAVFDAGFHAAVDGTLAEALRDVMAQALHAKSEVTT